MADEPTKTGIALKLEQNLSKIREWLNDQTWFQELRAKWDELDPDQQKYLKYAGIGLVVLFVMSFFGNLISGVGETRDEYLAKKELVRLFSKANQKSRKTSGQKFASTPPADWGKYMSGVGNTAGIPADRMSSKNRKNQKGDKSETLIDVNITKLNIKQLSNFIYQLETGRQPVKLRNLTIDTQGNEGWLSARLAISAFEVKN